MAGWLLNFPETYIGHVPRDVFAQGVHFPNFSDVWQRSELWLTLLTTVITLTLIDGTETLATITAIDKIDPFHRKSDPNGTLRTMGVSNILSGLVGGLTVIPGGIKSTANIIAGGRTLWANLYYALFMAFFVWLGTDLINSIPLTVLAALLIFIGWRLCSPRIFFRVLSIGAEQLLIETVCVVVTLYTSDILSGVIVGTMTNILVLCFDVVKALQALRPKGCDALILLLTAYGTAEDAVEAMKLGAFDFLIRTVTELGDIKGVIRGEAVGLHDTIGPDSLANDGHELLRFGIGDDGGKHFPSPF